MKNRLSLYDQTHSDNGLTKAIGLIARKVCVGLSVLIAFVFLMTFPATALDASSSGKGSTDIIDPTFSPVISEGYGVVKETIIQPDGKIIAVGLFGGTGGTPKLNVVRYNADGSIDSGFNPGGSGPNSEVFAVALQSDGKILIGGAFTKYNEQPAHLIARLNTDGTLDMSYGNAFFNTVPTGAYEVFEIAVQNDDNILVSGRSFLPVHVNPYLNGIFRLLPDGQQDPTFSISGSTSGLIRKIVCLPDGKILIGGDFLSFGGFPARRLARLSQNGTFENDFNIGQGYDVREIIVDPQGNIFASGRFHLVAGMAARSLVRFDPEGNILNIFEPGGDTQEVPNVYGMALQKDGRIIAGVSMNSQASTSRVIRFNSDGTLDKSFVNGEAERSIIHNINLQQDGRLIVAGEFLSYNGTPHLRLARIEASGVPDPSFNASASSSGTIYAINRQPDGKIVIGGDFEYVNGVRTGRVARLNANGTIDNSFGLDGEITGDVYAIFVEASGKIAIGGNFIGRVNFPATHAARLNSDGSFDRSLIPPSLSGITAIHAISAQSDHRLILAGRIPGRAAIRLDLEGNFDPAFTTIALTWVQRLLVLPDDRIIISGSFSYMIPDQTYRSNIARLNINGSLDFNFLATIFGGSSLTRDPADGSIFSGANRPRKFSAEGVLDNSFNPPENPPGFPAATAILVQSSGKVVYGGFGFNSRRPSTTGFLMRVDRFGTIDPTFNVGTGPGGPMYALYEEPSGDILIGGRFSSFDGAPAGSLVRLLQRVDSVVTPFDYDGDGRSDISVFRRSEGNWYIDRSTEGFFGVAFGSPTDKIIPADYDGDGKTDVAVFRPSTGEWYVTNSTDGTFSRYVFGISEDLPTPADYDGDGKADISVFRPSSGIWYRLNSSDGSFAAAQFGTDGDQPTIGDFDGDGRSDMGVFRPSNGVWYQLNSSDGSFFGEQFGISTDKIAPADYDGDGKTDIAIYRPSDGLWYVKQSASASYVPYLFGLSEDVPVPADFDGDGKADIGVFRPSNGTWYIANSSTGSFTILPFGQNGDQPTQGAFNN